MICELFEPDLDEIMALERVAFPPELQAQEPTYRRRFKLDHVALGLRADAAAAIPAGRLQGLISFSYGSFDATDPSTIPDTFSAWSSQPVPESFDTVFVYNLGIAPAHRTVHAVEALVHAALRRAFREGCHQAVAEGPIPSYAGTEQVASHPEIRCALDRFARDGTVPDERLLFRDPHLALYRRICRCAVIRVMANFLPADVGSGGFRAMLFRDLRDYAPALGSG